MYQQTNTPAEIPQFQTNQIFYNENIKIKPYRALKKEFNIPVISQKNEITYIHLMNLINLFIYLFFYLFIFFFFFTILRSDITKTCLYKFDPHKPHFYIVKLGFTGVYIIFLISAQNIDCGYSLEPPHRGGSNKYPQYMF